jgi:predicted small secreted protein
MKLVLSMISVLLLSVFVLLLPGCGTIGGAVSGAGTDLQKAGNWIKNR